MIQTAYCTDVASANVDPPLLLPSYKGSRHDGNAVVFLASSPTTECHVAQVIEATTANGVCTMRIKAIPLPGPIATAIDKNADLIRMTLASSGQNSSAEDQSPDTVTEPVEEAASLAAQASDTLTDPAKGGAHIPDVASDAVTDEAEEAAEEAAQGSTSETAADLLDAQHKQQSAVGSFEQSNLSSSAQQDASQQDSNHASAAEALNDASPSNGNAPHKASSQDSTLSKAPANGLQSQSGKLNEDDEEEQDNGDVPQEASGKVGIMRQRLGAAAKEAGNGAPDMLKVGRPSGRNLALQSIYAQQG